MTKGKTIYPSPELKEKILDAAGEYGSFSAEACTRIQKTFDDELIEEANHETEEVNGH